MRIIFSMFCLLSVLAMTAAAQTPAPAGAAARQIALWPKGAPGGSEAKAPEADTSTPTSGKVDGRPVIRIGNVSEPTIAVYSPAKDKANGAAVIVCPGGGYSILAMDLEGTEICEWLNSIGVTGVLLKYRVPAKNRTLPLMDAQRALSLTRTHAAEWGIDPARIGIMGFSAGGHLTAAASNNFGKRAYEAVDDADKASCRPDFALLIYPAYLTAGRQGGALGADVTVTAQTPPTFLVMAEDDPIGVENCMAYYAALKQAKVKGAMHLYPTGGHGYGLRPSKDDVHTWPARAGEWMKTQGLLEGKK